MFVAPEKISNYVLGYGKFFDINDIFFKGTDLGWIRLLLYGGIPICILFFVLNVFWIKRAFKYTSTYPEQCFNVLLIVSLIILNFKDLQYITFLGTFCYVYRAKLINEQSSA
jgi:hypothetical protein